VVVVIVPGEVWVVVCCWIASSEYSDEAELSTGADTGLAGGAADCSSEGLLEVIVSKYEWFPNASQLRTKMIWVPDVRVNMLIDEAVERARKQNAKKRKDG
jgi:hypothetical protein